MAATPQPGPLPPVLSRLLAAALLFGAARCSDTNVTQLRYVSNATALEDALQQGMPHIIITEHLDLRRLVRTSGQPVLRVNGTESIVGQCYAAEASATLSTPRTCVLDVASDGLVTSAQPDAALWLARLHFRHTPPAQPRPRGCDTLVRQAAGALYVSQCGFEGSLTAVRGLEIGDAARFYATESSIRGLSCGIGAGLLVGQGASAWLTDSDLSRNEATGQPPLGPAAHAERGAAVRLQQCIFGGNAVPSNATAGATAAAVSLATIEPLPASGAEAEAGALQGAVFSDAARGTLWVWVVDEQRLTGPLRLVGAQRRGRDGFARPRDESFNRIRQAQEHALASTVQPVEPEPELESPLAPPPPPTSGAPLSPTLTIVLAIGSALLLVLLCASLAVLLVPRKPRRRRRTPPHAGDAVGAAGAKPGAAQGPERSERSGVRGGDQPAPVPAPRAAASPPCGPPTPATAIAGSRSTASSSTSRPPSSQRAGSKPPPPPPPPRRRSGSVAAAAPPAAPKAAPYRPAPLPKSLSSPPAARPPRAPPPEPVALSATMEATVPNPASTDATASTRPVASTASDLPPTQRRVRVTPARRARGTSAAAGLTVSHYLPPAPTAAPAPSPTLELSGGDSLDASSMLPPAPLVALAATDDAFRLHLPPLSTATVSTAPAAASTPAEAVKDSDPTASTMDALEDALDAAHRQGALFAGRYRLGPPAERRYGGQGIVQFATDEAGRERLAIKFFLLRAAFLRETALLARGGAAVRAMMPTVAHAEPNEGGDVALPGGVPVPPFIVLERGESLDEWVQRVQPDYVTVLQVLCHIATRLRALHRSGYAHRDVKPANILWRPRAFEWTLIDFGCAARIGETTGLSFSLHYAPPEAVRAYVAGQKTIVADAAADMWAFGVVAFELLTARRAFAPTAAVSQIKCRILGEIPLPWETADLQMRNFRGFGMLRDVVRGCLCRRREGRPTSEQLHARLHVHFRAASGLLQSAALGASDAAW